MVRQNNLYMEFLLFGVAIVIWSFAFGAVTLYQTALEEKDDTCAIFREFMMKRNRKQAPSLEKYSGRGSKRFDDAKVIIPALIHSRLKVFACADISRALVISTLACAKYSY